MRITRIERRWASVVARALIPPGTLGSRSDEVDVGALLAADCEAAPWHSSVLLRLGLCMIWLAPLLRWPPRTFGGLPEAEREAELERLLKSRAYVVRSSVLFVKLMLCAFVLGDASLIDRLGAYRPPQPRSPSLPLLEGGPPREGQQAQAPHDQRQQVAP